MWLNATRKPFDKLAPPRDTWLWDRLVASNCQYSWSRKLRVQENIDVLTDYTGLLSAVVIPTNATNHSAYATLTPEADYCRRLLGLPLDGVSVQINDVWIPQAELRCHLLLHAGTNVPHPVRAGGPGLGGPMWTWRPYRLQIPNNFQFRNRAGERRVAQALWELLQAETGENPSAGGDGYITIPVLTLPLPLLLLLLSGAWRDIILLYRWPEVPTLPQVRQLRLEAWAAIVNGRNEEVDVCRPLLASDLKRCANFLRQNSKRLLEHDDEEHVTEFQLRDCLAILDGASRNLDRAFVTAKSSQNTFYDVSRLWAAFQVCSCLRDQQRMFKDTIQRALEFCFPPSLLAGVDVCLSTTRLPSKSTLQRSSLFIDAALMLTHRSLQKQADCIRVGWADASPQGGKDWLIIAFDCIDRSKIVELAVASNRLALHGADLDDEEAVTLSNLIVSSVDHHTLPPTHVPNLKSDLSSKVSLATHQLFTEFGWELVPTILGSFRSFCTDMGTELKMSSFAGFRLQDHMPWWFHPSL